VNTISGITSRDLAPDDVHLTKGDRMATFAVPRYAVRSLVIGAHQLVITSNQPAELREAAAALTKLADAANELAHWAENAAGDIESELVAS
jgi:hypothetical protein